MNVLGVIETKSANARILMDDFQMLTLGQGTSQNQPKKELGGWFGPAIDIGPAVTANIWRTMGKFVVVPSSEH